MSRSNPHENLTNVASRFYEWSGDEGKFKYFDKEKKEQVFVDLPFSFIVLDILSTVKGFDDSTQMGWWSNEVRNVKTDTITVRNKKGVAFTGLYEQAKEKLSSKGLKYYQSVYIAMKENKQLVIANIQLGGSGLSSFIEFCKDHKIHEIGVQVLSCTPKKKGKTNYYEPVYSVMDISVKTNEVAVALDKELQEYLTAYLAKNNAAAPAQVVDENQNNGLNDNPKKDAKSKEEIGDTKNDIKTGYNPFDDNDGEAF